MSDWSAFFRTDEFRQYRKRQVQKVAKVIERDCYGAITGNGGVRDLDRINGALTMAKELLRLPEELTRDEKLRDLLEVQMMEDMGNLTTFLIRQRVNIDDE